MTSTWTSYHWPRRSCLLVLVVLGLAQTLHAKDGQDTSADARRTKRDYCVVGAGPAGLQMAYFLQQAKRDYVVFERSNISGHFFGVYPKHRTLISINKRNTGQQNPDFNLRFDWNSLLSHDPSLLFKHFSRDYFPKADAMVKYLDTFRRKMNLQVQFNTEVRNVQKLADEGHNGYKFSLEDQRGNAYFCKILLVANGVSKPNVPDMPGIEMVTGYEEVSVNLDDFEAKTVMILGRGNSAFETANFIFPAANYVHMVGASPPRFAWSTHYVGDLRAVNNDILDNYQLKSLDGLLDADFTRLGFIRTKSGKLALTMRQDTNKRYDYDKNYDYSYNYNYNMRTQPIGGKSYNFNYNEETERTTDPKKVSRCFGYNYNYQDNPKSYNYNYNNPEAAKSYNYNYNHPNKPKSYNYNYNIPDNKTSYSDIGQDNTMCYSYNYLNEATSDSDDNSNKTKSYNYNYNYPDKTESYNYNYNNPDKTKSYNYNYNNPDKTKSYNYNYNKPDKAKSYNYNYNDKTKSYNYNYNNPDKTKSYNYNYNNPDKTKSYNYNYNSPDKTKSYNYNYNNPEKTKSYNYNYNNPDKTKSYNYNYNYGGKENETSDSSTNEDEDYREEYDAIIRCLGFGYDDSMFSPSTMPRRWEGPKKRYPLINADYESANVPGMYFVGSTVHSLDYREASGGFIHGFRYTTRVLHRLLEFKHEGVPWPSTRGPLVDLVSAVMKTINEASGIYQMHHFLAEVFIIDRKSMEFRHVPEYPLSLLKELAAKTGHEGTELLVLAMRLHPDFSGPRKDTFHENRATSDVEKAHLSNFLHPIIYYYDDISQAKVDPTNERNLVLPEPTKTHHVVEEFLIRWTSEHLHIVPLRNFVQSCLEVDLQRYRPADCLEKLMLKNESSPAPLSCLQLPEHVRPDVVVGYGGSYVA